MENIKNLAKKLTSKDEKSALEIAKKMVEETDCELFKELISISDYLFPFVRENVIKRIEKAVNISNYKNLYNFLDCYSPYYEMIFINSFRYFGESYANEKMLEYLKQGTNSQKTYAARYFYFVKDLRAIKELINYAFSEDEYLADACAAALGSLNEQKSYEIAMNKLNSGDDFEALSALNFFVSYVKNPPMQEILTVMENIGMPENFAGKIAYLKPLTLFLEEDLANALTVIDYILSGLGEIIPLSEVFNYEIYDVISILSKIDKSDFSSKIAVIMLRAKLKFDLICGQDEYIFDEDKNTKNELLEISNLLNSFGDKYYSNLKNQVTQELSKNKNRIISALEIINEYKINSAVPYILDAIYENEDETIKCQAFSVLKSLNSLSHIEKNDAISMFTDENLKALVENYYL